MIKLFPSGISVSESERSFACLAEEVRHEQPRSFSEFETPAQRDETENVYLPSQARIAQMCASIRRHWSDRELMKRRLSRPIAWEVPTVSIGLDSREVSGE